MQRVCHTSYLALPTGVPCHTRHMQDYTEQHIHYLLHLNPMKLRVGRTW